MLGIKKCFKTLLTIHCKVIQFFRILIIRSSAFDVKAKQIKTSASVILVRNPLQRNPDKLMGCPGHIVSLVVAQPQSAVGPGVV